MSKIFSEEHIVKAGMSYEEYRALIEQLLIAGKTTGGNQSLGMIDYTRKNVQRMNRLDEKVHVDEEIKNILSSADFNWYWVVLTEAWSGESAQNIPILSKIAGESSKISLKILLRDEEPEIMQLYFPDAMRSIPQLICIKEDDFSDVGTWGPRPQPVQEIVEDYKNRSDKTQEEYSQGIQNWYTSDKGKTLQKEMTQLINNWVRF